MEKYKIFRKQETFIRMSVEYIFLAVALHDVYIFMDTSSQQGKNKQKATFAIFYLSINFSFNEDDRLPARFIFEVKLPLNLTSSGEKLKQKKVIQAAK